MNEREARAAGIAWAEREAEALSGEPTGAWRGQTRDALPLIDEKDQDERYRLAEIANAAADRRWDEIMQESEMQKHT